jgi:hypothetical protein
MFPARVVVEETSLETQFLQAAYDGDWESMRYCLNVNEDVYTFVDSDNLSTKISDMFSIH